VEALTHFERLGLPRRFLLPPEEVERNYLARSRELHPDYHQLGTAAEQRVSLEMSAALNEAYATLRDPFRRAEYLLTLEGGPSAAEHKEMSPEFLEEMLELRMEIEEIREGGDASPSRAAMEKQLSQRRERLLKEVAAQFAKLEALPEGAGQRKEVLLQVRRLLNATRYIQGLLRDLRAD
jgi:molecular chaperone HscB